MILGGLEDDCMMHPVKTHGTQVYKQLAATYLQQCQHTPPSVVPTSTAAASASLQQAVSLSRMASYKSSSLAGCLLLAVAFLLVAVPMADAGAVFEIVEPISKNPNDYLFNFDALKDFGAAGNIMGSGKDGAGAVFNASAIPLAIFNLNYCGAISPHIHPNGAETLFVTKGRIRVSQFEQDGTLVTTEASAGQAIYIEQGSIHTVENRCPTHGTTTFLQLFDHPQAGTNFIAPAVLALPPNVVNSAFNKDVFPPSGVKAGMPLIVVRGCSY